MERHELAPLKGVNSIVVQADADRNGSKQSSDPNQDAPSGQVGVKVGYSRCPDHVCADADAVLATVQLYPDLFLFADVHVELGDSGNVCFTAFFFVVNLCLTSVKELECGTHQRRS